jgi:YegS/Rv2252/BmrU family lipid kinase
MILKQTIRFIVNPFSGTSSKCDIEKIIVDTLDHSKYNYHVKYTERAKHACFLAKEAKDLGIPIVAVVGGDGTVNEVAQELIYSEVLLAVLPGGSGNGFAMHLGMGRSIKKAMALLNNATSLTIDTGKANGSFFINVAGVGFDALIANKSKNDSVRGLKAYVKHTFLEALRYKYLDVTAKVDGQTYTSTCVSVTIANASMFGYNFTIAPEALLTDGLMDLVMIKKVSLLNYIFSSWRFLNKSIDKLRYVEIIKAKSIEIIVKEDAYFHVDGEGSGLTNKLSIELQEASLNILVPKHEELS